MTKLVEERVSSFKVMIDCVGMRALITGGAGFIGSHLVDRLMEEGSFVVCADDLSLGRKDYIHHHLNSERFVFVECDVRKHNLLAPLFERYAFDVVFHLAANSDIQAGMRDPSIDLERTFFSTYTVLVCMQKYGVKKIVFASTPAVYGMQEWPVGEDTGPLFPISLYGAAKLASEAYISAFVELASMQAWIFRFPNVIGERLTHGVIFDFIKNLRDVPSELTVLGDGKQEKPYMHVSDLIDGILFVFKRTDEARNYFHLGVLDATRVSDIARIVIEEMKLPPVSIVYTGGAQGWRGDVPRFQYDISKVSKLGWRAKLGSTEAVRHTVRALLDELSLK
ncbi:MAG: UDP-glucose 4-epimerase [Parcubacteria group bacterium Gr01-1014_48]|nr:MAG: UDP-glucose 4-epimerase [Parcubacteria group bacterium Greene0416_14]TSC74473.1 MAG: UDP-glucose 4-epimerase [Parcubacteria group bacterium Gr01-1014_48]TSD01784.1 MAG: UDP-glucose 4-epimerase [Parcubacteria group bacterium Greene1014_15]TSD08498.1 MAG: UDP-glucose 4-epimerase [Parcubacteria group bacterium Greene0714_4]